MKHFDMKYYEMVIVILPWGIYLLQPEAMIKWFSSQIDS